MPFDGDLLGTEQHAVLDEVAQFLANNDNNSAYTLSLFKKLQQVDRLGLR